MRLRQGAWAGGLILTAWFAWLPGAFGQIVSHPEQRVPVMSNEDWPKRGYVIVERVALDHPAQKELRRLQAWLSSLRQPQAFFALQSVSRLDRDVPLPTFEKAAPPVESYRDGQQRVRQRELEELESLGSILRKQNANKGKAHEALLNAELAVEMRAKEIEAAKAVDDREKDLLTQDRYQAARLWLALTKRKLSLEQQRAAEDQVLKLRESWKASAALERSYEDGKLEKLRNRRLEGIRALLQGEQSDQEKLVRQQIQQAKESLKEDLELDPSFFAQGQAADLERTSEVPRASSLVELQREVDQMGIARARLETQDHERLARACMAQIAGLIAQVRADTEFQVQRLARTEGVELVSRRESAQDLSKLFANRLKASVWKDQGIRQEGRS